MMTMNPVLMMTMNPVLMMRCTLLVVEVRRLRVVKKPDLVAPGRRITTTVRGGGFGLFGDTSAATPHVSGAVLLLADHGLWDPMMQKALLINSAEDRGDPGWDKDWGWGYIDLYAALEQFDYTRATALMVEPRSGIRER